MSGIFYCCVRRAFIVSDYAFLLKKAEPLGWRISRAIEATEYNEYEFARRDGSSVDVAFLIYKEKISREFPNDVPEVRKLPMDRRDGR